MRNTAGTANCKNAVFIFELLEGKAGRFIPPEQAYFHEGRYCQNLALVITWNIRLCDLAFI